MNEHERNLRDLAAMFAMQALIQRGGYDLHEVGHEAYVAADSYMEARNHEPEEGIAAIKKPRAKRKEE